MYVPMIATLIWGGMILLFGYTCVFVFLPLLFATWETCLDILGARRQICQYSKLCVGRVWHTRFHPNRHAFTYPIFMFALDLHEFANADGQSDFSFLGPLVRFRPDLYHLKNGEGREGEGGKRDSRLFARRPHQPLCQRILNLIASKTNQAFQPNKESHRIILLTHLEYYGYNFNPVSFYYIVSRTTGDVEAIVGEVSNTPWTEMYCYVLHPDSVDQVVMNEKKQEKADRAKQNKHNIEDSTNKRISYRFPKTFHVSPFMEMEYWYDWSFEQTPMVESFAVVNSLRRRGHSDERLDFTARLELKTETVNITPYRVAWHVIQFPILCLLIQIWIHYQAAWLFVKGIVYIPHPQGSETTASRAIATLMIPFFALRDYGPLAQTASTSETRRRQDYDKNA